MNDSDEDQSQANPYLEKARQKIASKRLKKLKRRSTLDESLISEEGSGNNNSTDESSSHDRSSV